jgi:hypothetical protein
MKESDVQPKPKRDDELADLIEGGQAIADYIGKDYRTTNYLLATGKLPAHKVGSRWYARRSKLRARLLGEDVGASKNGGA